ncbi:TolC family protein [Tellurirhabdus bombi]|uniref:TolC family protein n=1 Tax=Tellurirhabdus bombi TaxID=2907205 RepID=UPI001F488D8A|nr:TolC family protein [Tellurirhabdus bombi]
MKKYLICLLWLLWLPTQGQPIITLEQCYTAVRETYPLTKQKALIQQSGELAVASLATNRRLPQLALNGQATWQSEVTQLPIELPNLVIPTLSKDQYKLALDASYALYDGNLTRLQTALQQATTATAQQQIDVELHKVKDQVNGLFLQALLTDENLRLTQIMLEELHNRTEKIKASVRFGTASQMNLDGLQAEALRSEQRLAELTAARRGLRDALSLLTNLSIDDSTRLVVEENPLAIKSNQPVNRPELKLYDAQRSLYAAQLALTDTKFRPRLSLFGQGGAGRPALNFLNNDFRGFFIGGLRLSWNLSAGYTLRNDRQVVALNREVVDVQQATFEKALRIQLRQQQTEIERLQALLDKDGTIIALREKVRKAAAAQLDNGAIAARDYTTELNNENQALLNQKFHELQLLLARVQYRTLTGN